jgi:hypothetical protein
MGDLANLPTFQASPQAYTHADFNAIFQALTIAPNAVTLAKLQAIATDNLLGRSTGGSGNVELVPCTAKGRSLLAAANNSDAQDALGISAFVKTLLDDADAAAARTTLGAAPSLSTLQSLVTAVNQTGSVGAALVFNTAGAPTVQLTAGTWLVLGTVCVRESAGVSTEVKLEFSDIAGANVFGGGASLQPNNAERQPATVLGVKVVASGTFDVYFKGTPTAGTAQLNFGSAGTNYAATLLALRIA